MSEQGPTSSVTYDAADLRGRIAVSFSVPELRKLADSLGVSATVTWDRGTQEAVRSLVKQFERYYGLETLVAKLRELRPLVEWPEPQAIAPAPPPASTPVPASVPVPAPAPASAPPPPPSPFAPPPPLSASPGSFGAAPPLSSPGTFGAPPPPATSEPPDAGPILQDPMMPPAATAPPSRAAPYWPGLTGAPAEPSRSKGIDPRVLIAVAGLTVLAALIAYLAGRASNASTKDATDDAAQASARAPKPRRPDGPATRVAAALSRTLAAVGRVCEVPAKTPKDAEMLEAAFVQCGPAPPPPRPASATIPTTPPANTPPSRADRPAPRGGNAGAKDTPKAPSNPCLTACDSSFRACKDGCGPEPTQSSQYDNYQACRGRCLSTQSRCRLGCPQ